MDRLISNALSVSSPCPEIGPGWQRALPLANFQTYHFKFGQIFEAPRFQKLGAQYFCLKTQVMRSYLFFSGSAREWDQLILFLRQYKAAKIFLPAAIVEVDCVRLSIVITTRKLVCTPLRETCRCLPIEGSINHWPICSPESRNLYTAASGPGFRTCQ